MTEQAPMKTIRMTPEFMREIDALNPKGDMRTLQLHLTTDGTNVPREQIEAAVSKMIQNRIDGKCEKSKSFDEPPHTKRTAAELIEGLGKL